MTAPRLLLAGIGVLAAACAGCDRDAGDGAAPGDRPSAAPAAGLMDATTADGLVIRDLAAGTGPPADGDDGVEMRFTAMLADGTVFDGSERRRRTITVRLDDPGLIEGLRRGLVGVRAGGARRLEVPWPLGYGEHGRPPIPPRTDLVYEVEVVSIERRESGGSAATP